jgi:hypothetical protein
MILKGDLPQEERIRVADLMGWPSDFETWSRFIAFLLTRVANIPVKLYPDVVSIFEVWQNTFAGMKNVISDALLDQAAAWLKELSQQSSARHPPPKPSRWGPLGSELGHLRKSLARLLFRSAGVRADLARQYLTQIISIEDLRREKFEEVVAFSSILSRSLPDLLANLTRKHLLLELPEERNNRERREFDQAIARRKRAQAKLADQRTRADRLAIEGPFYPLGMHSFGIHDWHALAVESSTYFPPSPLREPFHSLFASAPDQALLLLADLSNHSITAWRQLHSLAHDAPGAPVPLEFEFPWGKQQFWGGDREYLWFRGIWGPHPIASSYLALEEWALRELERGRPADELIKQIVSGNQCIAVLGVAIAVALQAEAVSDAFFPLVTSQRLLTADHDRMLQDYTSSNTDLVGFSRKGDLDHVEAVKRAKARRVRHRELRWLIPLYFLNANFQERTKAAVLDFVNALPFQIEQHRTIPEVSEHLRRQALEYAELVDLKTYLRVPAPEGGDRIAIVHVSPTAASPERAAQAKEAGTRLREGNLWLWGSKYFETGQLAEGFTVQSAIDFAKSVDSRILFKATGNDADMIAMRRGAVAVAAAVALDRRDGVSSAHLAWARRVLKRAISAPEKRDIFWSSRSVIPWHHAIFVARGLTADLRSGTADRKTAYELLALVAHPLEAVSLVALEAALSLWDQDPKLGWSALHLALSLCILPPPAGSRSPTDEIHSRERIRSAVNDATRLYDKEEKSWIDLPLPPPAWVKVEGKGEPLGTLDEFDGPASDLVNPDERWAPSPTRWHDHYAAEVITRVPLATILRGTAAPKLLDFLSGELAWTISQMSPPWLRQGRRGRSPTRLFEWTLELGKVLGKVAGLCSLAEVEDRILNPIFALESDHRWELLAPFVDLYICMHVYDAKEVPPDAPALLMRCLEQFLKARTFDPETYRSGELNGFDQPRLAKALMFVAIDDPVRGAVRYANGDWSDIGRMMPMIDRFVRSTGWVSTIMSHFLTLCERAKEVYPAEQFADQVLHVIDGRGPHLKGWHGTFLPARIAGLVQYIADRETPMPLELGQKLLRILDLLVDMGDRRSAALQLSESFREIQVGTRNA